MEQNRRRATWGGTTLGIVLALVLNAALARAASDEDAVATEEFHQTYPLTGNGRIQLENINGGVHISVWDRNEVKVDAVKTAHDQQGLKDVEIRVDTRAGSIAISTHYGKREENRHDYHGYSAPSVEYTLTVPRNARLDEIKLINGPLDVAGVTGEVRASCINGKLAAHGLAGEVKLATINGPLEADFERVAPRIELSSVNGEIRLTLPSDAKARVEATTVHGWINNNFGLHTNDHRWVGHDLNGELGGGGAEIRLRNVNGPVEIRHADDSRALSPA
ncbi:MAG TPA: DUF4097 family beta strand repeat-containing protein, partial [Terriglobales bacterium]|nr:DUF4097 family beta strand repeat-containing protein [Terriglobales bacterium]